MVNEHSDAAPLVLAPQPRAERQPNVEHLPAHLSLARFWKVALRRDVKSDAALLVLANELNDALPHVFQHVIRQLVRRQVLPLHVSAAVQLRHRLWYVEALVFEEVVDPTVKVVVRDAYLPLNLFEPLAVLRALHTKVKNIHYCMVWQRR